ncbi:rhodanese-related sulfurtransferase [Candidatus Dependentiae bacterium]|nr:rhodanese-related sulfurtransferase [Candidatus Dependentiae bacterium]MCC7414833.1 rhodanese-related sulfurtransferase [Campylobacterota bacterium]
MNTILLFYKYVHIDNPVRFMRWQKKLCTELGLKGRIIIAQEGINGTVGGLPENTERYKKIMAEHPLFGDVDFKESQAEDQGFPRMRIVVRSQIVETGLDATQGRPENTGTHLTPAQTHALIDAKPDNLVILDTRNRCESAIGSFTDAVKADIDTFRDFPAYVDKNLEQFKDKQVLMYCTGGVRCERATAYLKEKGVAEEVYHIEGGIHRYVEQFPDGHFRGKNYVFDGRIAVKVTDDILGACALCATTCDEYYNCLNASCNKHFIACQSCIESFKMSCSSDCYQALENGTAKRRPLFKKTANACVL